MSDLERISKDNEEPSKGPSLTLLYSLIALALLAAIGCAALIVLPFYRSRH
ncbi:MAG TPA: hypothetical protein VHD85_01470 [Terracidiphilus sp.]|nr:hypothetical protein [Terracidiphilus sp.]